MAIPYSQRRLFRSLNIQWEFIKSSQFSLITTIALFWVSQGKKGLCAKQKSSTLELDKLLVACKNKHLAALGGYFF